VITSIRNLDRQPITVLEVVAGRHLRETILALGFVNRTPEK
jgi:hypothetical protein